MRARSLAVGRGGGCAFPIVCVGYSMHVNVNVRVRGFCAYLLQRLYLLRLGHLLLLLLCVCVRVSAYRCV